MVRDLSGKHGKLIIRGGDPSIDHPLRRLCACGADAVYVELVDRPTTRLKRDGRLVRAVHPEATYVCEAHSTP